MIMPNLAIGLLTMMVCLILHVTFSPPSLIQVSLLLYVPQDSREK
jgi:hypothetical protein